MLGTWVPYKDSHPPFEVERESGGGGGGGGGTEKIKETEDAAEPPF